MTTAIETKNRFALITGGTSGIGAAIAEELAAHGAHLALVGRDRGRLARVAEGLRARHGVTVVEVAVDLAESGGPARVLRALDEAGIEVELLVGAAGMSMRAPVAESDPEVLRRLVDLNVGALTELTTALVAGMVSRGHGSVLNIASTGAATPAPLLAAYAASKAYVLSFTQALWAEVRDRGVSVVAVIPGPTQTAMNPTPGRGSRLPAQVARTALAALGTNRPTVIDGVQNRVTMAIIRALPTRFMTLLALRVGRRRDPGAGRA